MALTSCPECGNKISSKAENCPYCGYQYKKSLIKLKRKHFLRSKRFFVLSTILLIVVSVVLSIFIYEYNRKKEIEFRRIQWELDEELKNSTYPWRQWERFDLRSKTDYYRVHRMLETTDIIPDSCKWYERQVIDEHFNVDWERDIK